MKEKQCGGCGKRFAPARPLQSVCSQRCALRQLRERKAEEKRQIKARLEAIKPLRQVLGEVQRVFNAFIRERDKALPCISCGRFHQGAHDAGHYLSTGARPELRFDEANVHRQCVPCNQHKSGNAIAYRQGLIARVGLAEVERLEGPHPPRKWTRDELDAMKKHYSAARRALEKGEQPPT